MNNYENYNNIPLMKNRNDVKFNYNKYNNNNINTNNNIKTDGNYETANTGKREYNKDILNNNYNPKLEKNYILLERDDMLNEIENLSIFLKI